MAIKQAGIPRGAEAFATLEKVLWGEKRSGEWTGAKALLMSSALGMESELPRCL